MSEIGFGRAETETCEVCLLTLYRSPRLSQSQFINYFKIELSQFNSLIYFHAFIHSFNGTRLTSSMTLTIFYTFPNSKTSSVVLADYLFEKSAGGTRRSCRRSASWTRSCRRSAATTRRRCRRTRKSAPALARPLEVTQHHC